MSLEKQKRNWDDIGDLDPLWAILSKENRKFGKWNMDEFFQTGEKEIGTLMHRAADLGYPNERNMALDFGCGVGRLTRSLAKYFDQCVGVDISDKMISKAKEYNRFIRNCKFILNESDHLHVFPDHQFDLVYSNIVLQHIPSKLIIRSYIADFLRILKENGLLVFQLPCYIPPIYRFQIHARLYSLLKGMGFSSKFLYERAGLFPIRMTFIPEVDVVSFLKEIGAKILWVEAGFRSSSIIQNRIYYITK